MSLPIIFRPEALDDLSEAFQWYEEQRSGLGVELMAAVDARLEQVQAGSRQFPRVRGLIRRAIVHRFHTASSLLSILSSLTSSRSCTMREIRSIGVDVLVAGIRAAPNKAIEGTAYKRRSALLRSAYAASHRRRWSCAGLSNYPTPNYAMGSTPSYTRSRFTHPDPARESVAGLP